MANDRKQHCRGRCERQVWAEALQQCPTYPASRLGLITRPIEPYLSIQGNCSTQSEHCRCNTSPSVPASAPPGSWQPITPGISFPHTHSRATRARRALLSSRQRKQHKLSTHSFTTAQNGVLQRQGHLQRQSSAGIPLTTPRTLGTAS